MYNALKKFHDVCEFVTIMATCQEKSKEATILHVLSTLARFEKQSLKQCTFEDERYSFDKKCFLLVLRKRSLKQCTFGRQKTIFVENFLRNDP